MGNYLFNSYEQAPVKSYTINSYADSNNLIIDHIEKNSDGDIIIFYKVIE